MTYKLFIDDERYPIGDDWVIARSHDEVMDIILDRGMPIFVSFDHDLGENKLTGYDIAKTMVEYAMDGNAFPKDFAFYVHSQNPVGKANIEAYLNNYMKVIGL